jgi:RHS repeat-associated protein
VVNTGNGAVVEEIDYDEFGNVMSDSAPGTIPFGFAGGLTDVDTGLVRFGARDYDPGVGRWTSKDPMRLDGGQINFYAYVGDDPVNRVDPTGLGPIELVECLLQGGSLAACLNEEGNRLKNGPLQPILNPPQQCFDSKKSSDKCNCLCIDNDSYPPTPGGRKVPMGKKTAADCAAACSSYSDSVCL